MIPVTKPFLPPLEEYKKYIDAIWQRQWLTNMGPLANDLETSLKKYLGTRNMLFVTNGTVALQLAIKALELKGEVITTPFSFVATTSSIAWEGCVPIFVDIDKNSLCIDPDKIEAAITGETSAILATHVYGNPCDVVAIEKIARKHNLKVIYDGAHAFGVKVLGKSIFEYGDISTCSLHATKLFHSTEGGFIVTRDDDVNRKLAKMRNFGISGVDSFSELGLNGKNSELHAAMGLTNLKYIKNIHEKRKSLTELYDELLLGFSASKQVWREHASLNYAYYPIILESEDLLLKVKAVLETYNVFSRRYFYPSLASSLPYLEAKEFVVNDDVCRRVLCLPLYYDLSMEEVRNICSVILSCQEY